MGTRTTRTARRTRHRQPTAATPLSLIILAPGLSLCKLAKLTGIALPHLSRIFSGKRGLTIDKARAIAKAIGVPMAQVADLLHKTKTADLLHKTKA